MNKEMNREFTVEEVHKALMQMHPMNAPGLDRMSPMFFQQNWHIVGKSITKALLLALHTCEFPCEINHTFITLIPNKNIPLESLIID